MSILFDNPPPAIGCGDPGDPIDFGCLFDGAQRLVRIPAVTGNRRLMCAVFWVKRSDISATGVVFGRTETLSSDSDYLYVPLLADAGVRVDLHTASAYEGRAETVAAYRDPAGFSQFHIVIDTENDVAAERIRITKDGIRQAVNIPYPILENTDVWANVAGIPFYIGVNGGYGGFDNYLLAILCDFAWFDGVAPSPTEFGYFNSDGAWVNRTFASKGEGAAVYGLNGFHLDFADPLDLGKDVSGNGNHFTSVGLTVDNQVTDTPSNNAAVSNALDQSSGTLSDGNRSVVLIGTSDSLTRNATLLFSGGNYYEDFLVTRADAPSEARFGVLTPSSTSYSVTRTMSQLGAVVGDTIRIAVKSSTGEVWWAVNNVWHQGDPVAGTLPMESLGSLHDGTFIAQQQSALSEQLHAKLLAAEDLTPLDGFKPLSSVNVPCPAILKPDDYFTVRLSSGGADITDLPWNPLVHKTLVVSKRRYTTASWRVSDTVRGNNLAWRCDVGGLEIASSLAFSANGINVGADTEYQGSRVDYFWRASPKAGFDIIEVDHVTGTPTVVPHLAGGLIDYAWLVPLDGGDVRVFHRALPSGQYLRLNGGSVAGTDANWFASTAVNLTIGASLPTGRYSLPVWRTVPQFSAFVAYGGNSSADGAFCPLDFLPRMAFIKTSQAPNPHYALDIDRAPGNPITNELQPGTNGVENTITIDAVDFVSNGLKQRSSTSENNTTPNTIIPVAAWAQTPGKFARAR